MEKISSMHDEINILANQQIGLRSADGQFNSEIGEPKVSILIISYNQKDYVAEALESAINQDYENLEVVISDDGSTDGTAEIIAQWQSRYPERLVALLNKDNVGITRNSNRALHACTGEFIAVQGGDDILLPGKIAAQVQWFLEDQERVLCGHQVEMFYEGGLLRPSHLAESRLRKGKGPEDLIRNGVPFPATAIMIRANVIPSHGFDESIPMASDWLFWIEVLMPAGKFGYVDGIYARYRRHDRSVSLKRFEMLNDVERTLLTVANRYPQYREICMDSIIRHVIYFGGVRHLNVGNKRAARERFIATIQKKPLFVKAWIRLLQTF